MPPGAVNPRENRFSLLADGVSPSRKRTKTSSPTSAFPELPKIQNEDPKYVIMSTTDDGRTMASFSAFAVYKAIQAISKEFISITELRDGNLLLLVKNKKIADRFIATNKLNGVCGIKCKLHESLNTTKGTIYAPYLNNVPETEIANELKEQGVSSVYKFIKKVGEKQVPSGVLLLSFDLYTLPDKLDVAWHSVKVKEYIPNPMRCKTCQLLGHTAKWCKNTPMCVICNLPPHSPEICARTMCANCSQPHPSSSIECPIYQQQKSILAIKIKNKCSMGKARQIYKNQTTNSMPITSYANIVSNFTNTPNEVKNAPNTTKKSIMSHDQNIKETLTLNKTNTKDSQNNEKSTLKLNSTIKSNSALNLGASNQQPTNSEINSLINSTLSHTLTNSSKDVSLDLPNSNNNATNNYNLRRRSLVNIKTDKNNSCLKSTYDQTKTSAATAMAYTLHLNDTSMEISDLSFSQGNLSQTSQSLNKAINAADECMADSDV